MRVVALPAADIAPSAVEIGLDASRRWGAGLALAVLGFLAILIISGTLDAGGILRAAARVDVVTLTVVLSLSVLNYGLRGLRWHLFSRQVAPNVPLSRSMLYYLTGFAFLVTPAKVGEFIRLWLLKQRHGVPYPRSLGLLVVDRAADAFTLAGFAALGLLGQVETSLAPWICLAALVAIGGLAAYRPLVVAVVNLAHRASGRRWPGVFLFVLKAHGALLKMCRPVALGAGMVLSLLAWGAQVIGLWLLIAALGYQFDLAQCAAIFALSALVGAVPFLPGGVGGAEATMIGLLALAGMPGEAAVAVTMISRLATIWFALLIGLSLAPFVLVTATRIVAGKPSRSAD